MYQWWGAAFGGSALKNLPATAGDTGSIPESGRSPGGGNGNAFQYSFLPGESHGQRGLEGYSLWGCQESEMTDH